MSGDTEGDRGVPKSPVLFIVDDDDEARHTTESALVRRFGSDYQVVASGAAEAGLNSLKELADRAVPVALVAADLRMPEMNGLQFLDQAHSLHRGAGRALLVTMDQYHTRIPFSELAALQRAMTLGQADFWLMKGWTTPEEWLYPQVQEALTAWTLANRPHHLVYRIVGEQWAPHSHELREVLGRNSVPFAFYAADSAEGQRLVRELGI